MNFPKRISVLKCFTLFPLSVTYISFKFQSYGLGRVPSSFTVLGLGELVTIHLIHIIIIL